MKPDHHVWWFYFHHRISGVKIWKEWFPDNVHKFYLQVCRHATDFFFSLSNCYNFGPENRKILNRFSWLAREILVDKMSSKFMQKRASHKCVT